MTNDFFDQSILPESNKPYKGPLPNVQLKLTVESMAANIAHYFSGYEDALKDTITRTCKAYLQSPAFEQAIQDGVKQAVNRTIEAAAAHAVYSRGLHNEIDAEIKKRMPDVLNTALAQVRNR